MNINDVDFTDLVGIPTWEYRLRPSNAIMDPIVALIQQLQNIGLNGLTDLEVQRLLGRLGAEQRAFEQCVRISGALKVPPGGPNLDHKRIDIDRSM